MSEDKVKQTVIWMAECGWRLQDVLGAFEDIEHLERIKKNWEEWRTIGVGRREGGRRGRSSRATYI